MPRTSKKAMMDDEIQVLRILEKNARVSIDEIAKKCGFSRQKVWRIIRHLETEKIIWGYSAISDETIKNLKHFIALIKGTGKPLDEAARKEITFDRLDNYPKGLVEIEDIYYTHGVCDLVLIFYAPDIISAKKFLEYTYNRYHTVIQEWTLVQTLFPIRKQGLRNPSIKDLVNYM
jgi:DNA-binding Lrp family transcriptional regulator